MFEKNGEKWRKMEFVGVFIGFGGCLSFFVGCVVVWREKWGIFCLIVGENNGIINFT